MSLLGGLPVAAGPGLGAAVGPLLPADGRPVATPDPAAEVVAAAGDGWEWGYLRDGECRRLAPEPTRAQVRAMLASPAVHGSHVALKAAVLAGGLKLLPAVTADANPARVDPEAATAADVAAECARLVALADVPVEVAAWELLDAPPWGHKLAEVVLAPVAGGPDAGKYRLRALKVKPRRAYQFRVDAAMNLVSLRCRVVEGGWADLDPAHFALFTWDPECGDPRGRSSFRPALMAWDMLAQLWPEALKGWRTFGTPSLFGTLGDSAQVEPPLDADGRVIPGRPPVPATTAFAQKLVQFRNNKVVVGPKGSDVKTVESARGDATIRSAVELLEAQVVRAILLQLRATVEAQHGSKADSETAQDVMGTLVRALRTWFCAAFRASVVRALVVANRGEDVAARLTPLVSLGEGEHQDFAAVAGAIAGLFSAGYLAPSQLFAADQRLNLPVRGPDELPPTPAAAAERAAQAQARAEVRGDAGAGTASAPGPKSGGPADE